MSPRNRRARRRADRRRVRPGPPVRAARPARAGPPRTAPEPGPARSLPGGKRLLVLLLLVLLVLALVASTLVISVPVGVPPA
ncbi:hypothetical protein [Pseudonocardia ammonioxydans]|uniref:hypothetical protein n=1 Tax=Pseudonocardia ammonioxydans TaxID=260086 RepID=UPI000B86E290|nr:hypothetical protein [Pseudonocardia ammonioxydans]